MFLADFQLKSEPVCFVDDKFQIEEASESRVLCCADSGSPGCFHLNMSSMKYFATV